ncbi:alpha-beta hydrolase superfamily lysophospholipase [Pedobacter sp. UYP24]
MIKFNLGVIFCILFFSCSHSHGARSQEPTSFPYKQEEVSINNTKVKIQLAGTLTIPSDVKVSKIVILITGSGPQNRNEELLNHRPFLVLSDWLTRNGIAVLRYDDRGVGKSTGTFSTSTTFDFADDVEAAISFIHSRKDLNKLSIGLIGHSEGGLIYGSKPR